MCGAAARHAAEQGLSELGYVDDEGWLWHHLEQSLLHGNLPDEFETLVDAEDAADQGAGPSSASSRRCSQHHVAHNNNSNHDEDEDDHSSADISHQEQIGKDQAQDTDSAPASLRWAVDLDQVESGLHSFITGWRDRLYRWLKENATKQRKPRTPGRPITGVATLPKGRLAAPVPLASNCDAVDALVHWLREEFQSRRPPSPPKIDVVVPLEMRRFDRLSRSGSASSLRRQHGPGSASSDHGSRPASGGQTNTRPGTSGLPPLRGATPKTTPQVAASYTGESGSKTTNRGPPASMGSPWQPLLEDIEVGPIHRLRMRPATVDLAGAGAEVKRHGDEGCGIEQWSSPSTTIIASKSTNASSSGGITKSAASMALGASNRYFSAAKTWV